jgi:hypothetical protein
MSAPSSDLPGDATVVGPAFWACALVTVSPESPDSRRAIELRACHVLPPAVRRKLTTSAAQKCCRFQDLGSFWPLPLEKAVVIVQLAATVAPLIWVSSLRADEQIESNTL